ncbi:helix-turn-helix domain-containing protein [Bacillus subtilis]|uniref:helix-turn-helix domain-containing protein n=1 Tax=Bacillus subtilis TaxID=1423 RepID=UPI0018A797D1|nr:helix-turn-helix domain-containing protein [Bacillus subtilis]MBG9809110.1 hypothetical protein [Bacillus subtilis]QPG30409.1 helix-turn-helix domain-containing protein [Bacillus subtilis]QTM25164.1 helix-turn-helix domain-containing protein [Bacillus subtilis]ULN55688.1 helix-turn-helix domain-containing protein [Bacillus subtilis]WOA21273.1 helix-turn-helix domain-containing protein [Bacillus subtilis]
MTNAKRPIDFHDHRFVRVTKSVIADETYLDKPVQKLVYAVLCFHADNTSKKSHPSVQTIADKCRCSTNTVRAALRRLKELELIDVKERKNGNGQTSNEYTLWEPPEWFVAGGTSKNDNSPLQDLK